jgi:hypothetical protein
MLKKIKIIGVAVLIIFFLLGLLSALQFFRFQHLLFEITQSRVEVVADALKRDIERSVETGIALQSNAQLPMMLSHVIHSNPNILAIEVSDLSSASREVLWSAGKRPISAKRSFDTSSSNRKTSATSPEDTPVFVQHWSLVDALGVAVARLTFISDKAEALSIAATALTELLRLATHLFIAALALLAPILFFVLTKLDNIVLTAKSVMLGETVDENTVRNSEVCQLAQNAQAAKPAKTSIHPKAAPV